MNVTKGVFLAIAVLSTCRLAAAILPDHAVSSERIQEISAWLPDEPAAPGARIGDRTAWGRLAALPSAASHIRAAVKLLDQPVPECPDELYLEFTRTGNRTHYQKPYAARVSAVDTLLMAECLEDKGRFMPKLLEYVQAICSERSWTLPAHDAALLNFNGTRLYVDLGSAARAVNLAIVYDWLRDRLPEDVKCRIFAECDRRIFQPYLNTSRDPSPKNIKYMHHWWYFAKMNWNSVCNSCVVRAALAMIPDRRLRAEFVASAEKTVPFALEGYTPDGYCSEGMGYWNYGYGHHLMLGLAVRAATGGKVDFFASPRNRAVMMYPYGYQLQAGRSPHFADGGGNPSVLMLALQRQVYPDITCKNAENAELLRGGATIAGLRAFGQEPAPSGGGLDVLPSRSWFPDAQVLISRLSLPEKGLNFAIAFKGGHNAELHNHNDVGSYAIMVDGCEMGGDPGGEIYTRRTFSKDRYVSKVLNSYGHPVPVVAGVLQKTGRSHAAKVLRTDFTDARDEIEIDYAAAYDVPVLKSLVRTMVFDREKKEIMVSDRVAFSEPSSFQVPVVTYRNYTNDVESRSFTFKKPKGHRALHMEVETSSPVSFADEKIENPGRPDITRLAFTFCEPVTNAVFTTTYKVY